MSVKVVLSAIK